MFATIILAAGLIFFVVGGLYALRGGGRGGGAFGRWSNRPWFGRR